MVDTIDMYLDILGGEMRDEEGNNWAKPMSLLNIWFSLTDKAFYGD